MNGYRSRKLFASFEKGNLSRPLEHHVRHDFKLHQTFLIYQRSSHQRCSMKKGVLRNFTKFIGKHFCQSLILIKLQTVCNFIKNRTLAHVFSCEFCEISKNTFFTEHLWTTVSDIKKDNSNFKLIVKRVIDIVSNRQELINTGVSRFKPRLIGKY